MSTILVAYKEMSGICAILALPVVQHIIKELKQTRDMESAAMTTDEFKYHTILKYLRKLERYRLIRRERLGNEVTYRLNHERYELIQGTAVRFA